MPSSPNYVRDLVQEHKTEAARGGRQKNIVRKQARRDAVKAGLVKPNDGKDIDHIKPLSKGGGNTAGNLRVKSASDNRSFPRKPSGAMK